MRHFFKLIRYKNLILIALMQLVIRYGFFKSQNTTTALADWQFGLLVLATILIAAAGFVIYDLFDEKLSEKNGVIGKSISESNRYNLYFVLNITGVAIGFYLSNLILRPSFASVFILVAATLYIYATALKKMVLINNILVATMISCSIIITGIFDLLPAIYDGNQQIMANLFSILLDYAIFVFSSIFIREIVIDLANTAGENSHEMTTLPAILGAKKTTKIVFVLSSFLLILLTYYVNIYFMENSLYLATLYFMIFILAPLLYFAFKIWNATTRKEFQHLSSILKLIHVFGIIAIAIVSYNSNHHA